VSNHIDKYVLEKYFKGGEAGALVLFSSLFYIFALPVVYFIEPTVFSLNSKAILILSLSGAIDILCLILYFKALQDSEASTVVPFYQTIPIFGFILGYFILGETLGLDQILACALIIAGTIIVSLDFDAGKISIKKKVAALMISVSALYATAGVIFKMVAVEEGFWASIFWSFAGSLILGIILFIFIKSYRRDFLLVLKNNTFKVISLNAFNETIFIIAEGAFAFASLLAPIALVMTVNGFQPLFVFAIGIFMTMLFPKLVNESLSKNEIAQKILAIGIITVGTYLLGVSGAL
jgi:uncharacterized membrane protein